MFNHSIHIFRRDLRLIDNTALNEALKTSKQVSCIFILDPNQVSDHPYRSKPGMEFMFNSLTELNDELKKHNSNLNLFYGNPIEILSNIFSTNFKTNKIDAVFLNRDYTPFSTKRDEALYQKCKEHSVEFFSYHDALLTEPLKSVKPDSKPYTVFTPFFKKNSKLPPNTPVGLETRDKFSKNSLIDSVGVEIFDKLLPHKNPSLFCFGGRIEGLNFISQKIKNLTNYNDVRNIPSVDGTTGLSAHHKFGTVSIRESFWAAKNNLSEDSSFISELYWRDFFTSIGYFFPHVYGKSFNPKFDNLVWDDSEENFKSWCEGNTGFPIVDAGMRQLNQTGWMHNRVRMITASFLIKDLHIDWRLGEKYFARTLIDYDPAVNNGSWQWAASTGCDAQPYFRIFNPKLQQEKFDPQCIYIKKWIPELYKFTSKQIHNFELGQLDGYTKPVIEHAIAKKITEEKYNACAKG
jgi:deoxyribodipyrimidine photo-lyase